MLHLSASCRYYLYRSPTDMRKGFDSLCGIVTSELQMNVLSGSVFIFINKKHTQVKLLLWEGFVALQFITRDSPKALTVPAQLINGKDITISNEANLQPILPSFLFKKSVITQAKKISTTRLKLWITDRLKVLIPLSCSIFTLWYKQPLIIKFYTKNLFTSCMKKSIIC